MHSDAFYSIIITQKKPIGIVTMQEVGESALLLN